MRNWQDLQAVEQLLAQELVPVPPDEAFVRDMAARLQDPRVFEVARESGVLGAPRMSRAFFLMGLGLGLFLVGLGLWFAWRRARAWQW